MTKHPGPVLHVITGLMTGGAEKALVRVTGALANLGIASMVLGFRDGPILQELQKQGIEACVVSPVNPRAVCAYVSALKQLPESSRPAVVQGWMYHGNIAAFLLGRMLGVPIVLGVRQNLGNGQYDKFLTRVAIRVCAGLSRRAAGTVYNSSSCMREHVGAGYSQDRSAVIPNGFDINRYAPNESARHAIRQELQIPESAIVIGHVGRSHVVKNQPMFIRVAAGILAKRNDVHAVMVGHGTSNAGTRFLTEIKHADLGGRFHFLGERLDLEKLYCAMDVLCLTSWSESFPNVLGEAMACAVPCVATNVGDVASIIGSTGALVPVGDSTAMADAVGELLALDKADRAKLGVRCRERVASEFSIAKTAQLYRNLYDSILEHDCPLKQSSVGV